MLANGSKLGADIWKCVVLLMIRFNAFLQSSIFVLIRFELSGVILKPAYFYMFIYIYIYIYAHRAHTGASCSKLHFSPFDDISMSLLWFALCWDRFWKPFWLVLGSPFRAGGFNKLSKCHRKSMRKLASEKVGSEKVRAGGQEGG